MKKGKKHLHLIPRTTSHEKVCEKGSVRLAKYYKKIDVY